MLGASPLSPGWARWRLAPQPSDLTDITASVPTPAGVIPARYTAAWVPGVSGSATVSLVVLPGQSAQVCLALPGPAAAVHSFVGAAAASDVFTVDGAAVPTTDWGRFRCTTADLMARGSATVVRREFSAA